MTHIFNQPTPTIRGIESLGEQDNTVSIYEHITPASDTWAVLSRRESEEPPRAGQPYLRTVAAWAFDGVEWMALVSCASGHLKTIDQLAAEGISVGYVGPHASAEEYRTYIRGLLAGARYVTGTDSEQEEEPEEVTVSTEDLAASASGEYMSAADLAKELGEPFSTAALAAELADD